MGYDLEIGKRPEQARTSHTGERIPDTAGQALNLEPGLDVSIPLSQHFNEIKEQVESHQPMSAIRRCSIQVSAFFSDQQCGLMALTMRRTQIGQVNTNQSDMSNGRRILWRTNINSYGAWPISSSVPR